MHAHVCMIPLKNNCENFFSVKNFLNQSWILLHLQVRDNCGMRRAVLLGNHPILKQKTKGMIRRASCFLLGTGTSLMAFSRPNAFRHIATGNTFRRLCGSFGRNEIKAFTMHIMYQTWFAKKPLCPHKM